MLELRELLAMLDGRKGRLSVPRTAVENLDKAVDKQWLDSIVKIKHGDEERYMANLELFHNVHCLVRKLLIIFSTN
jgi:hypothetical protein